MDLITLKLSGPARRALQTLPVNELADLTKYTRQRIAELHGMGPVALGILEQEMQARGLQFLDTTAAQKPPAKPGPAGTEPEAVIDHYIREFPPQTQARLQEIRSLIQAAAPAASEKISYAMPTYYLHGNLVHFAAFQQHIGFYPGASGVAQFEGELQEYKHAKGSIQFPLQAPLPADLITRIVRFRVGENLQKATPARKKPARQTSRP